MLRRALCVELQWSLKVLRVSILDFDSVVFHTWRGVEYLSCKLPSALADDDSHTTYHYQRNDSSRHWTEVPFPDLCDLPIYIGNKLLIS